METILRKENLTIPMQIRSLELDGPPLQLPCSDYTAMVSALHRLRREDLSATYTYDGKSCPGYYLVYRMSKEEA